MEGKGKILRETTKEQENGKKREKMEGKGKILRETMKEQENGKNRGKMGGNGKIRRKAKIGSNVKMGTPGK